MFPELEYQWTYIRTLWDRLQILREDDGGAISVEMVLVIVGILVAVGVLVAAIQNRVADEAEIIEG